MITFQSLIKNIIPISEEEENFNLKKAIYILLIAIIFTFTFSFSSYIFSKKITIWLKKVIRIDNRKDIEKSPKLRELISIIREISLENKFNMPEVGIYPSREINAFAIGTLDDNLIAFSTSIINKMDINELKGVVGHEISHIMSHDLRRILVFQGFLDSIYLTLSFFLSKFLRRKRRKQSMISNFLKYLAFNFITKSIRSLGILSVFWYNRKRELKADLNGSKIVGIETMILSLKKLHSLETRELLKIEGLDLSKDDDYDLKEPNSISFMKFNGGSNFSYKEKRRRKISYFFSTHPTLKERIEILEKLLYSNKKN